MTASALVLVASASAALAAPPTVWDFNPASPLAASAGPGVLTYRGNTGSVVQTRSASQFGIPLPPGGDTGVMLVPTLSAAQGLALDHASPPNGVHLGDGWVSNYTIAFDLLIPSSSFAAARSLFNTNPNNANDGDAFITNGRVGLNGFFNGQLAANTWHRVVIVVGAADGEGMSQTYIDGVFVGGQGGTGSGISGGRWGLFAQAGVDLVLFGDDNGQTAPVYVSSMMFVDERLSQSEAAAFGGPTASGLRFAGAPGPLPARSIPCGGITAHRGNSGDAPENTLAAIDQAIALGSNAIEMDVHLSAGGTVVLMHDSTVDRTTNLSGSVGSFTPAQLGLADAGSWFDDRYAAERVPTLAQALLRMKGTGVIPYLDVKQSGMAPGIKAALQQAGMTEQDIWLWAYNRTNVAEFNAVFTLPKIVVGEIPRTPAQFAELRALNVVGLDLGYTSYTGGSVDAAWNAQANAEGFFTSGYTVVTPDVARTLILMGVDYVETDFPGMVAGLGVGPAITQQPADARACAGGQAGFVVSSPDAESFRWRRDGVVLTDGVQPSGSTIAGSATRTLLVLNATAADQGLYDCVAGNACTTTLSASRSLTICLADLDCSGDVDLADFFTFFGCYDAGGACADIDGVPGVDLADFFTFFAGFDAGC